MISKTCKPAKKSISSPAQPKQELLFVNAEEEFFYEVSLTFTPHPDLHWSQYLLKVDFLPINTELYLSMIKKGLILRAKIFCILFLI